MTGTNLPAPELTPISLPAVQALLRRAAIFLGEHHPDLSKELRESANRLGLTIHSMTTSVWRVL